MNWFGALYRHSLLGFAILIVPVFLLAFLLSSLSGSDVPMESLDVIIPTIGVIWTAYFFWKHRHQAPHG